eukprot:TRINITY_DN2200_c0_g1_i1.p1 TRINITY_DN2200_c0_g1~~TRINITY_DN2200_c0_g1_i1.p1  ORF type:complete len:315 (+),score=53.35 TRINITY_DN2200_c0_g1_i1:119-1063(+)
MSIDDVVSVQRVLLEVLSSNATGSGGSGSGSGSTALIDTVDVLLRTTGILSFFGALFIIISFFLLKDWSFPNNIIFVLSVCDLLHATIYFAFPSDLVGNSCIFEGAWASFWALAAAFWTFWVAVIYYSQFTPHKNLVAKKGPLVFHGITWSLSLLLAILPIFTHDYASYPTSATQNIIRCWIGTTKDLARFWGYYIWIILIMILIAVMYTDMIIKIRRSLVRHNIDSFSVRWYLYPIIFWLSWLCPVILRILDQIYPDNPWPTLVIIGAIAMPLQGFLNAIVYGVRSSLIERIKRAWYGQEDKPLLLRHDNEEA